MASTPSIPPHPMGEYIARERHRQGLTQHAVSLKLRCYESQVRSCESGQPVWKIFQAYVGLLAENAPKGWLKQMERSLDRPTRERLGELSPAGRLTVKALMLQACRDSSVGRAAAYPSDREQLKLFPLSAHVLG